MVPLWLWAAAAHAGDVTVEAAVGQRPVPVPAALALGPCLASSPATPMDLDPVGRATIELRIRRGKLAVVARSVVDAPLQASSACFERELAAATWPIRRGRLAVSVAVAPESSPGS